LRFGKRGMRDMFSNKSNDFLCKVVACAILLGLVTGCAGTRMAVGPPQAREPYTVYPPDALRRDVRPETELSTTVTVRPDGRISMAILGDVEVEGLTPAEIDEKLTQALTPYVRTVDVTVTVTEFNSKRYYVIGEVAREGDYPFNSEISAWEAVAIAGGYTRRAAPGSARVVRGDPENPQVLPVNIARVALKGETARDIILQESDVVYVPPDAFARVGYFFERILFPFSSIFGLGRDLGYALTLRDIAQGRYSYRR
jgi:polysaccharide export outer membrane protein